MEQERKRQREAPRRAASPLLSFRSPLRSTFRLSSLSVEVVASLSAVQFGLGSIGGRIRPRSHSASWTPRERWRSATPPASSSTATSASGSTRPRTATQLSRQGGFRSDDGLNLSTGSKVELCQFLKIRNCELENDSLFNLCFGSFGSDSSSNSRKMAKNG